MVNVVPELPADERHRSSAVAIVSFTYGSEIDAAEPPTVDENASIAHKTAA
jgi:hypothetical protein